MKKFKVLLITVLTFVVCAMMLVACGAKTGVYKFKSMKGEANGVQIEAKVGDTFMGMVTLTEDYMTIELKEDGTYTMTSSGHTTSGTWAENAEDSGKVDLTMGGNTVTVSCDGSTIVFEEEGMTITLEK